MPYTTAVWTSAVWWVVFCVFLNALARRMNTASFRHNLEYAAAATLLLCGINVIGRQI